MDLYRTIQTLHEERKRLEKLIESLEQLQASEAGPGEQKPPSRRGRKGMSADERQKVSERMKKYWAARRDGSAGTGPPQASAAATSSS